MKDAYNLILATAFLFIFPAHLLAVTEAGSNTAYTLLYSSNVTGEIEPCG